MEVGEDIGPDQKYLSCRSVKSQTVDNAIFECAEDIVNNFNRIEQNLDRLKRERYIFLSVGFFVGLFFAKYGY